MNLPQLPTDKANHFIYGSVIFLAAMLVLHTPLFCLAAVLGFAVAKEALDYMQNQAAKKEGLPAPHGVEILDVVATTAGGAVCFVATMLV